MTDSCAHIIGGVHPNPIPGQRYSVALLAKWNWSNSAQTVDVHTRNMVAIIEAVRNMATNPEARNPQRRKTAIVEKR